MLSVDVSRFILDKTSLERDVNRSIYRRDPERWVREVLGYRMWSKQGEIMRSVRDNIRTAVYSCHSSGKSFISAVIAAWWIECHSRGDGFVVTSAPTGRQVKNILWPEIRRAHVDGQLSGRTNLVEWISKGKSGSEEIVAFGCKPGFNDEAAFQGIHRRNVLVIFDEASGMRSLWDAAESLISNVGSKFLVIGNPDFKGSKFYSVCTSASWKVIRISAFDTPNFTGEVVDNRISESLISPVWVDHCTEEWGQDSAVYARKVEGRFPDSGDDTLIPYEWIEQAQELSIDCGEPTVLGCDIGAGGNRSVICLRRGNVFRIVAALDTPNTMETLGHIIRHISETKATHAYVDKVGVGLGVVDRSQEMFDRGELRFDHCFDGESFSNPIVGVNVGESATDKNSFVNLKSELLWKVRQGFEHGRFDIDPDDLNLQSNLMSLAFKLGSNKIEIQPKKYTAAKSFRETGSTSTDYSDAMMLTLSHGQDKSKPARGLIWGSSNCRGRVRRRLGPRALRS